MTLTGPENDSATSWTDAKTLYDSGTRGSITKTAGAADSAAGSYQLNLTIVGLSDDDELYRFTIKDDTAKATTGQCQQDCS